MKMADLSMVAIAAALVSGAAGFAVFKAGYLPFTSRDFEQLVVVDDTRGNLSFEEQVSLSNGLGDALIDPVSAQVRKLERSVNKNGIVCGEVNSKNKLGGYVGFTPFFADVAKATVLVADEELRLNMPRVGCPTSDAANNTRVAANLSGFVTDTNFDQFQSFIADNTGKSVGLTIRIPRKAEPSDRLFTYASNGMFKTSIRGGYGNKQIRASKGWTFSSQIFQLQGFFRVNFEGRRDGSDIYALQLIDNNQIVFSEKLETVLLKQ